MTALRTAVAVLAIGVSGACSSEDVESDDVIAIDVCPGDGCANVADGSTAIPVQACVPTSVEDRRTDLDVTFSTSRGTWQEADPDGARTLEAALGSERCVTRYLVPPLAPGTADVIAELGGYRSAGSVTFAAVGLASVEVVPQPGVLSSDELTSVLLETTVRATSGTPSEGTTVGFEVAARVPATAAVSLFPRSARLDADGKATATIVVAPGTESVTLNVVAVSAPDVEQATTVELVAP